MERGEGVWRACVSLERGPLSVRGLTMRLTRHLAIPCPNWESLELIDTVISQHMSKHIDKVSLVKTVAVLGYDVLVSVASRFSLILLGASLCGLSQDTRR